MSGVAWLDSVLAGGITVGGVAFIIRVVLAIQKYLTDSYQTRIVEQNDEISKLKRDVGDSVEELKAQVEVQARQIAHLEREIETQRQRSDTLEKRVAGLLQEQALIELHARQRGYDDVVDLMHQLRELRHTTSLQTVLTRKDDPPSIVNTVLNPPHEVVTDASN